MISNKSTNVKYEDIQKSIPFLKKYGYEVQKLLGFGSYGVVFLARNEYDQQSAIKLIPSQNLDQLADHFIEASIMRQLNSKNTAKIQESFVDPENKLNLFIVCNYYSGGDLQEYITNKHEMTEIEIVQLFYEILIGIQVLHSNKIIHSDLKPENILLTSNNRPIISDFGMANVIKNNKQDATKKGYNMQFSPIELLAGNRISYSTDFFSLGMILYTLCGQKDQNEIYNIKLGNFPDLNSRKFSNLLLLAKKMMSQEPVQRMTLNEALQELKIMYPTII